MKRENKIIGELGRGIAVKLAKRRRAEKNKNESDKYDTPKKVTKKAKNDNNILRDPNSAFPYVFYTAKSALEAILASLRA